MKNKLVFILIFILISSCDLPEGPGGKTTIRGHVLAKRYNSDYTRLIQEYYAPDERVFITYGTDTTTHHDDVRTHYDGSFEFRYLREGTYTVYCLSKDTLSITGFPEIPSKQTITIKNNDKLVEVDDLIMVK